MEKTLKPKRQDGVAVEVMIGRVSTPGQDISNIDASFAYLEPHAQRYWSGKRERFSYGDQGSGLSVFRTQMLAAEAKIASGVVDVVYIEDISRAYREPTEILHFLYRCGEQKTRVICPGDGIDTADDNWFTIAMSAVMRHSMHISDTRRRVRRTADHSFDRGGMVTRHRFGYRKLTKEEANSGKFGTPGLVLVKDSAAAPVIAELLRLVTQERLHPADLARWLNKSKIAPGPYAKKGKWNAVMVRGLLANPILYGNRTFRDQIYEYNMNTHEHVREKNPAPLMKVWPELAYMTEDEFRAVNQVLDEICATCRQASTQTRKGVPHRDATFPHKHLECRACHCHYVDTGYDFMKCYLSMPRSGNEYWNCVQVRPSIVTRIVADLLIEQVESVRGAKDVLINTLTDTVKQLRSGSHKDLQAARELVVSLDRRSARTASAISATADDAGTDDAGELDGERPNALVQEFRTIQKELRSARRHLKSLEVVYQQDDLPVDADGVRENLHALLVRLAKTSYEFGELMRKIVPTMEIIPMQAIDSGQVHPKLVLMLDLGVLIGQPGRGVRYEFNAFVEAVHYRHRSAVVAKRAELVALGKKASLNIIAAALGIGRMTVRRALTLHAMMEKQGLSEPYFELKSLPASAARWRRRKPDGDVGTGAAA